MKTTIVPAQITTVEDKIAGGLSLSQVLLLVAPVFIGAAIFIVLPPSLEVMAYKVTLISVIVVLFCALAIRIKGRILLLWAVIIARYNLRPRYHVFNKNDMHLRDATTKDTAREEVAAEKLAPETATLHVVPDLSPADAVRLRHIIADPKANLHFKTDRKGALRVYVTEVKQESVVAPTN
jgi:PrgI family protein